MSSVKPLSSSVIVGEYVPGSMITVSPLAASLMAVTMSQGSAWPHARLLVPAGTSNLRSEEHTSELQSRRHLVCRLLLEKKNNNIQKTGRAPGPFLYGRAHTSPHGVDVNAPVP